MVDIRWHQQIIIFRELIEDGVIFEATVLVAKDRVGGPHDGERAHRSGQQVIEEQTGISPLNANFSHGGDIENGTVAANRMILSFCIAIIVRQRELIPVDVMLVLN